MSKNRNTVEKRLRENEKKRKALEKLESKQYRKSNPDSASSKRSSIFALLSESEQGVLEHFRRFLMTPGRMLFLNAKEIEAFNEGLQTLIQKQMLALEGSRGAYSLTPRGFEAMNDRA